MKAFNPSFDPCKTLGDKWLPIQAAPEWKTVKDMTSPDASNKLIAAMARRRSNGIAYHPDPLNADHWQSPLETTKRGRGDCEDIAIYAMWCAAHYMDVEETGLVVGYERGRRLCHAIARIGDLYLDCNYNRALTEADMRARFTPVYEVGFNGWRMF
jgi:hypothetical protein